LAVGETLWTSIGGKVYEIWITNAGFENVVLVHIWWEFHTAFSSLQNLLENVVIPTDVVVLFAQGGDSPACV
jgi:hypothetical protein